MKQEWINICSFLHTGQNQLESWLRFEKKECRHFQLVWQYGSREMFFLSWTAGHSSSSWKARKMTTHWVLKTTMPSWRKQLMISRTWKFLTNIQDQYYSRHIERILLQSRLDYSVISNCNWNQMNRFWDVEKPTKSEASMLIICCSAFWMAALLLQPWMNFILCWKIDFQWVSIFSVTYSTHWSQFTTCKPRWLDETYIFRLWFCDIHAAQSVSNCRFILLFTNLILILSFCTSWLTCSRSVE